MSEYTQILLKNDLAEIDRLNQEVAEFGAQHNLTVEEEYALYLCLEELVTNVINYAWPEGGEHELNVIVAVNPEEFRIEIEDNGIPFDPTQYPEPDLSKPPHERQIGGMGLHLVRKTIDHMSYQRDGDINRLLVRKKRAKVPA
ncbi:MAG: ATP-binding protein [Verrucomicrobiota bacterium]